MIFALGIALLAALITSSAELSRIASLDTFRALHGEPWRVLSCHLTHLTWRQYAVDAPAFALLFAAYIRRAGYVSGLLLALISALSVSAAVIFMGLHQFYGGLSGLSYAFLSALIIAGILEKPRNESFYFAAIIFCVYLLFMNGVASGVNVAKEAHFAGAVSGAIFELMRTLCVLLHLKHTEYT